MEDRKWMRWANNGELAELLTLKISVSHQQRHLDERRKLIRDRCYQRARRAADKEG